MSAERVTIAQVAIEAGVSSMTVSNVMNGRPGASDSTRERVLAIAERLGYQSSHLTRSLRSGRTGMIGIVSLDLSSEYSHEIIRGITETLTDDERELLINVSVDAVRERERIQFFARDLVDGILLIAPVMEPETVELVQTLRVPVVVIDPRRIDTPVPRVTVDNYGGVRAGTEHLLALGHRRIAYIRGDEDLDSTELRRRGYLDAMALAGVNVGDELTADSGFSHEGGRRAATELIARAGVTAIIGGSDLIALGAVDAARTLGLDVPGDLSVVGFDDVPRGAQNYPGLTTVRQPLYDMGRAGALAVVSLVEERPLAVEHIRLPTSLVVRGTTGRAPHE